MGAKRRHFAGPGPESAPLPLAVAVAALRDLQEQLLVAQRERDKLAARLEEQRQRHACELAGGAQRAQDSAREVLQLRQLVLELKEGLAQALAVRAMTCALAVLMSAWPCMLRECRHIWLTAAWPCVCSPGCSKTLTDSRSCVAGRRGGCFLRCRPRARTR